MDKKNFEKDINVPSKNIEYHNDAKDCELAKGSSCCWCKNMSCYQLEQQLKIKEKECENNKIAYQMEVDIYNQECLKLLEELRETLEQLDQLKAENEELKKCYKNNSALLDFEETNTTKLVNKVMKLSKTLAEIKEIAEKQCVCGVDCIDMKQILQKISEVEDEA